MANVLVTDVQFGAALQRLADSWRLLGEDGYAHANTLEESDEREANCERRWAGVWWRAAKDVENLLGKDSE